jgi:hypothetical protein
VVVGARASGLVASGDDSAAAGFFLLDDLVDLVGGLLGAVPRYEDNPVGIGGDDVAGRDDDSPDGDRGSDDAWAVLERAGGGGGAGEDDQPCAARVSASRTAPSMMAPSTPWETMISPIRRRSRRG